MIEVDDGRWTGMDRECSCLVLLVEWQVERWLALSEHWTSLDQSNHTTSVFTTLPLWEQPTSLSLLNSQSSQYWLASPTKVALAVWPVGASKRCKNTKSIRTSTSGHVILNPFDKNILITLPKLHKNRVQYGKKRCCRPRQNCLHFSRQIFTKTHNFKSSKFPQFQRMFVGDSPACNHAQNFGVCAHTLGHPNIMCHNGVGTWNGKKNFNSWGAVKALQWQQHSFSSQSARDISLYIYIYR